jgi:protein SCO1/2
MTRTESNPEEGSWMEGMTRRRWVTMAGVPVVAGLGAYATPGSSLLPGGDEHHFEQVGPGAARAALQQRHLPNVSLVANNGKQVRFYDDLIKDRKVVLTFVSTRAPSESKKVMDNLSVIQRFFGPRIGGDIFLYTIARTPERDTPGVMRKLAAQNGAGPGWKFLTGKPSDVEQLRRGLGFVSEDPAEDANPAYSIGLLRRGIEPEMRWAHCQAQGPARVIAHAMLLDFGAGPVIPNSRFPWKLNPLASPSAPPIYDCRALLAELPDD